MKNKIILAVFLFGFILPQSLLAQNNYEDVIYLKNGSIIHGMIIEQIPNESVKIQTKDKNIFVYKMDEIQKITKEEAPVSGTQRRESARTGPRKRNGFTNITELSFTRSLKNTITTYYNGMMPYQEESEFDKINNGPSVGIQTINGIQFSPYISAGLGLGINIYSNLVTMPLFLGIRANMLDKRCTPFAAFDIGFSYSRKEITGGSFASDNKGGLMVSPGIGVKFFVIPKMALNLSLGFRYQEIQIYDDSQYNTNLYTKYNLRLLNLKFGFTF